LAFHQNGEAYLADAMKLAETHRNSKYLLGDLYGKETESQLLDFLTDSNDIDGEGEVGEEGEF